MENSHHLTLFEALNLFWTTHFTLFKTNQTNLLQTLTVNYDCVLLPVFFDLASAKVSHKSSLCTHKKRHNLTIKLWWVV